MRPMYVRRFTNSSWDWEEISREDYLNAVEWAGSAMAFVEVRLTPPASWLEQENTSIYEVLLERIDTNWNDDVYIIMVTQGSPVHRR